MYHKIARIWIFEIWKKIELRFQLCAERIFIHGKIPFIYIYSHNTQKKKQKCSSVERSTHLFWIKCKMNSPTINPYIVDPMKIQPKSTEKKTRSEREQPPTCQRAEYVWIWFYFFHSLTVTPNTQLYFQTKVRCNTLNSMESRQSCFIMDQYGV